MDGAKEKCTNLSGRRS